jgi:uncharacterized DUF497 family protein
MEEARIEWDPAKAKRNLRDHGISFEEAESVFRDDFAILLPDPDHSREEDRFLLLGSALASAYSLSSTVTASGA